MIADRNFYCWKDWCAAAGTGAALLWRVKSDILLPVLELLPDGSYRSVLVSPKVTGKKREALLAAARARRGPGPGPGPRRPGHRVRGPGPRRGRQGRADRPDHHHHRSRLAPAAVLARAYHQRWEHETGNQQLKTYLRGPGKVLRSQSPDMVRQEIWGYRRPITRSAP